MPPSKIYIGMKQKNSELWIFEYVEIYNQFKTLFLHKNNINFILINPGQKDKKIWDLTPVKVKI